jgi:hypothetical protein
MREQGKGKFKGSYAYTDIAGSVGECGGEPCSRIQVLPSPTRSYYPSYLRENEGVHGGEETGVSSPPAFLGGGFGGCPTGSLDCGSRIILPNDGEPERDGCWFLERIDRKREGGRKERNFWLESARMRVREAFSLGMFWRDWEKLRKDLRYYAERYSSDTRRKRIILARKREDGKTEGIAIPYTSRLVGYNRSGYVKRIRKKLMGAVGRCSLLTITTDMNHYGSYAKAYEGLRRSWEYCAITLRKNGYLHGEYLDVPEVGNDGNLHLHVFMEDCDYIPQPYLVYLMEMRYQHCRVVDIREVNNKREMSGYLAKYLGKNLETMSMTTVVCWALGSRQISMSRGFLKREPRGGGLWWFARIEDYLMVLKHAGECAYCREHLVIPDFDDLG